MLWILIWSKCNINENLLYSMSDRLEPIMLLKLSIMLLNNVSTFPSAITFGCTPFVRWWWQSSSQLLDSTTVNYFTCKQSSQLEKPYSAIFFIISMSLHHIHSKYSLLIVTYTMCYTNYIKLLRQSMTSSGRGWGHQVPWSKLWPYLCHILQLVVWDTEHSVWLHYY